MKKTLLPITLSFVALAASLTGCGSFSRRSDANQDQANESDSQKIERLQTQNSQLSTAMTNMTAKLSVLQTQITAMSDKLDATRGRVDTLLANQAPKTSPTRPIPTEGALPLPPAGDQPAESSFVADEAVRSYRQAMLLFDSRNYPDSEIAFSAFVERFPDHPLAGSAQYFLGESYFKQNEYKLAVRELQRVITTYDRSPRIAETLRDLSISEDKTGLPEDAARHRQLLTSLFPHSPAAAQLPVAGSDTRVDLGAENPGEHAPKIDAVPPSTEVAPDQPRSDAKPIVENHSGALDAPPPTAPLAPSDTGKPNP